MKRLFSYVRRYWNRYAFGMVSTLIASACGMSVSYLSGAAINTIQAHHPQTFGALARMGLPAQETLDRIVLMMIDRKSTRLNSSHEFVSRMPSSA